MYMKLMGPEDCPDSDTRKTFRLIQQVLDVSFERHDDGKCYASYRIEDGDHFTVPATGNVYVLNDQGKTVASFGPAQYVRPNTLQQPDGAFLLFVIDGGRIQWQASYTTREEAVAELTGLRPDGISSLHEQQVTFPAAAAPLSGEGIEFAFIVESPHFVSFV